MPFILYYDRGIDKIAQWYVPKGAPVDVAASTLGIVAMSVDRFPGIALSANSPVPTEENPAV